MSTAPEPPHLVLACVVEREGRYLLIEESAGGVLVLNQPAGHWEYGESFTEGARRETLEESGWHVEPTHLIGVYEYQPDGLPYTFVRLAFAADAIRHDPDRPLDEGIVRALWMSRDEIAACPERHRSPMVLGCIDDHRAGQRVPLSVIRHL